MLDELARYLPDWDEQQRAISDLAVRRPGARRMEVVAELLARLRQAPHEYMSTHEHVMAEVERAMRKFPTWPTDPLHALAVLGEEFGELTKAVLQLTYEPHKVTADDVRAEAMQTAAMALRFAMSLDVYVYKRSSQHAQS